MLTCFPSHMKEHRNAFWKQSRASELCSTLCLITQYLRKLTRKPRLLWLQVFPLCWRDCKKYRVSHIQQLYGPQLKECLGLGTA